MDEQQQEIIDHHSANIASSVTFDNGTSVLSIYDQSVDKLRVTF